MQEMPKKTKTMTEDKGGSQDRELVSMMGMAMLDKGGLQTIQAALEKSQDPAQVISHFMAQLIGQQAQYTEETLGIDPAVYTQKGGFLDNIVDYIERKLGLPAELSDQVYGETIEVMKAIASDKGPPQGGAQPGMPPDPNAAPPMAAAPPAGAPPPPGLDQGVM